MLQKLIADRYLTIPTFDQTAPAPNLAFPANFAPVPNRNYNIQESTNVGTFFNRTRSSQVTGGTHGHKGHRSFRWLPWVLGKVSCVPLAGTDILTGRMSGCWLVIFDFNAVRYAGHIGTDTDPNTPNSLQAKAAWRNAVNANLIAPVAAFNPVGPNLPANNVLNLKGEGAEFFGAFEPNGQVYTVVLSSPGNVNNIPQGLVGAYQGNQGVRRIARVVQMPTTQDVTAF